MEGMDIDLLLFKLIKKYDIYKYIPEAETSYSKAMAWQLINEKIEAIPEGKVVALRGGGSYAQAFWSKLSERSKSKVAYVIDCNLSIKVGNLKVIHNTQLEKFNIDVVIITSWNRKAEFVYELLNAGSNVQIIEPYDYLEGCGIHFSQEIFAKLPSVHITYLDVNNTLGLYKRESNKEIQKYYLEKLIAQVIEIKDFISAEKYICQYIDEGWDEYNKYKNFINELKALFEKIKDFSKKRNKKDIIINWVDNVNAEECYSTDFIKKRRQDSCVFSNAFTVTPWTHFAIDTLFTGKLPIEDRTYFMTQIDEENSPIIKMLQDADYQFEYIANPTMYQRMFKNNVMQAYPESFSKVILNDRSVSECSTRLQWISLRMKLMTEKPICHLIHNFAETHRPVMYTEMPFGIEDRGKCIADGLCFIMRQLDWYSEFYGDNSYQIWLSDHGDELLYERAYEFGRTNVMLVIKGPNVKVKEETRLYSHQKFSNIIKFVMTEKQQDWDECFGEYVLFQNLDLYHYNNITIHIMEQWLPGKQPHITGVYQLRGIRTAEDMYIKYAFGKELYYRLPDEELNLIEDEKWETRISMLRNLCGDSFVDISKEPLFEHSNLIYEYLKCVPQETIRW